MDAVFVVLVLMFLASSRALLELCARMAGDAK
jgi:hypothetical protein